MMLKEPYFGQWYNDGKIGSGTYGTVYSIYRMDRNGEKMYAAMKVLRLPRSNEEIRELLSQGYSRSQITEMLKPQLKRLKGETEVLKTLRGDDHIVIYEESQLVELTEDIGWEV